MQVIRSMSLRMRCAFSMQKMPNSWHVGAKIHLPEVSRKNVCAAQWIFWFGLSPAEARQYPICVVGDDAFRSTPACPDGNLVICSSIIAERIDGFQARERLDASVVSVYASLPLKMMQVNANTWRTKAKRANHLKQCSVAEVHVIGVQEARRNFTGVVTEYGYTLAQAACAKNGSGGVLVAVSSSLSTSRIP